LDDLRNGIFNRYESILYPRMPGCHGKRGGAAMDPDRRRDRDLDGDFGRDGDVGRDGGLDRDVDRDRDTLGRARNARARDELGRPLPRGVLGVEGVPEGLTLPPEDALVEAQRLLDADRAFGAHEVLEGAWKAADSGERELWRGLAQLAVGVTHTRRGNAAGSVALLTRAGERLRRYAGTTPYGIDVDGLVDWATALASHISRDGLAVLTRDDVTPRLRI
jgi:uncharacterized protein